MTGISSLPMSSFSSSKAMPAASIAPAVVSPYASAWPAATFCTAASASVDVAPSLSLMPSWASER